MCPCHGGDGRTDFFLSNAATGLWYVAITGNLSFTFGQGAWTLGWTFSPGDFNGDGKADLLL